MQSIIFTKTDLKNINAQKFYYHDLRSCKYFTEAACITNSLSDPRLWKAEICIAYFYTWSILPIAFRLMIGKRTIVTGGMDFLALPDPSKIKNRLQQFILYLIILFSKNILCVSTADKKRLDNFMTKWRLGFARSKIRLSFHPVDIEGYSSQIMSQADRLDEGLVVAWQSTVSNVIRKGCLRSLYLTANIVNYINPSFRLHILGLPGAGTKLIRQKLKELGINKNVVIHGEVSESIKMKMMKEIKYYFCLSYYEGFGLAALEAVASKMIVLHTNVGGLQDSVSDLGVNVEAFDKSYTEYVEIDSIDIKEQTIELYKNISLFSVNQFKLRSHLAKFTYESRSSQILSCYE